VRLVRPTSPPGPGRHGSGSRTRLQPCRWPAASPPPAGTGDPTAPDDGTGHR